MGIALIRVFRFIHIANILVDKHIFHSIMSSDGTAYSPSGSPRAKDWAETHHNEGQYGSGPGLKDPDSAIQNSDQAYANHLEKQANTVGPSPATRRPSDTPRYGHFEHREERGSPTLSPPPPKTHLNNYPTASTAQSTKSNKTQEQLDRQHTISTIRTKIGLAPDPPIVDGHDTLRKWQCSSGTSQHRTNNSSRRKRFRSISEYKLGMGPRGHARNLRCWRLRRLPQSRCDILLLPLPQTSLETLSHLLPRASPRRILCIRRCVRKLHQRHRSSRRPWYPDSSTQRYSNGRYLLHISPSLLDQG